MQWGATGGICNLAWKLTELTIKGAESLNEVGNTIRENPPTKISINTLSLTRAILMADNPLIYPRFGSDGKFLWREYLKH